VSSPADLPLSFLCFLSLPHFKPRPRLKTQPTKRTNEQPIVSLDAQDSVAQALSTLSKSKILSAPLVVGPPSLAFEGRPPVAAVAAFVGVADVVDALLDALPFEEAEGTFDAPLPTDVERRGAELCSKTLGEVFGASSARGAAAALERLPEGKLADEAGTDWVLKRDDDTEPLSLLSAITEGFLWPLRVAAGGSGGQRGDKRSVRGPPLRACHRIALFGGGGEKEEGEASRAASAPRLSGLLSQSDALAWLVEASSSSPALRRVLEDTPAAAAGAAASLSRVLTVPSTATALAALRAMRSAGVSAAAVVEEGSGVLLGSLSASDARYMRSGLFGALCVPVTSFLAERPLLAAAGRAAELAASDAAGLGEAELAEAVEDACKSGKAVAGAPLGGAAPGPAAVGSGRVVSAPQFEEEEHGGQEERGGQGGGGEKKRPTSLGAAAAKMVEERVHRCWIVSPETGVVVGCVTATDVLLAVQRAVEAEAAGAGTVEEGGC